MPVFDLYSRRKKLIERSEEPEVYQYQIIPEPVRVQIIGIWRHAIGPHVRERYRSTSKNANAAWRSIHETFAHEKGVFELSSNGTTPFDKCACFLLEATAIDDCLDVIDFTFNFISTAIAELGPRAREQRGITQGPEDAIDELNFRLREAGVGYQFDNGKIIRVDSQFLHQEVVRPALHIVQDPIFEGAQEEFLNAHTHYRAGEYKDAIVDALNAFESTMRSICDAKCWNYPPKARASDLLKVIRQHKLLPDYLDASFDQLAATLQSGLPTVRNEEGGHGQGSELRQTPAYVAAYALHLAASNIVLLGEAFRHSQ